MPRVADGEAVKRRSFLLGLVFFPTATAAAAGMRAVGWKPGSLDDAFARKEGYFGDGRWCVEEKGFYWEHPSVWGKPRVTHTWQVEVLK